MDRYSGIGFAGARPLHHAGIGRRIRALGGARCHCPSGSAEFRNVIWWPWKANRCTSNGCSNTSVTNGLDPAQHTLVQAVVSDQPGTTLFYVGMPKGGQDRADQWYGQAIARSYEKPRNKAQELYEGIPVIELKSGWKSIEVQAVTLGSLLRDLDRVDLIDMDVQGEELKIVRSAIDDLDRKVCRLHIGTHAHEVEKGLKETLGSHGWNCHFDYPCSPKRKQRLDRSASRMASKAGPILECSDAELPGSR